MKVSLFYCHSCKTMNLESEAHYVDPNVKDADGLAATYCARPGCYPHEVRETGKDAEGNPILAGGFYRDDVDKTRRPAVASEARKVKLGRAGVLQDVTLSPEKRRFILPTQVRDKSGQYMTVRPEPLDSSYTLYEGGFK